MYGVALYSIHFVYLMWYYTLGLDGFVTLRSSIISKKLARFVRTFTVFQKLELRERTVHRSHACAFWERLFSTWWPQPREAALVLEFASSRTPAPSRTRRTWCLPAVWPSTCLTFHSPLNLLLFLLCFPLVHHQAIQVKPSKIILILQNLALLCPVCF